MAMQSDEETEGLLVGVTTHSAVSDPFATAEAKNFWQRWRLNLRYRLQSCGLADSDDLVSCSPMVYGRDDSGAAYHRYRAAQLGLFAVAVFGCIVLVPAALRPRSVDSQGLNATPSDRIVMDEVHGCGYVHHVGHAIPGFNTAVHVSQSPESCRRLCSVHNTCMAVEFATGRDWGGTPLPEYSFGTCIFQSTDRGAAGAGSGYMNLDLYIKKDPCGWHPLRAGDLAKEHHGEHCDNFTHTCAPPHVCDERGRCKRPEGPTLMTFYMYRAQGVEDYPPENVNMADLAGVLWYLHREVVSSVPRKFHITRILRFKVTMKNTQDLYDRHPKQFGPFVAFDSATAHGRTDIWRKYGFLVGCQIVDKALFNYAPPCDQPEDSPSCHSGTWYSLPGACPEKKMEHKYPGCSLMWPGGRCPSAVVTGQHDCTYWAELAGEISLDELEGIKDYKHWWIGPNEKGDIVPNGNIEYNYSMDRGVQMSFWNGRHSQAACTGRMNAVADLFKHKYPDLPRTLPEPPCD